MKLEDIIKTVSKLKRKNSKTKVTQKMAVGMGVIATVGVATGILIAPKAGKETIEDLKKTALKPAEAIKDMVQKNTDTMKDTTHQVAQEVSDVMEDVSEKSEDIQKEFKNGYTKVAKDINKTAENISKKF